MSRSSVAPKKFFWLDIETTGLEPTKGDRIWEVAAVITDVALDELDTYHSLVFHDEAMIKGLFMKNDFWSANPATLRQILDEIAGGKPESEVGRDLIDMIGRNFVRDEVVHLAGNTIYFDKGFMKQWLPDFDEKLRYRVLDVSSFKLWWMAHGKPEYKKQEKHRALDDIRESIAELKHYTKDIKFGDNS